MDLLLSKGLKFNTYQQMQPIRASANQSSASSAHMPAGVDEHRKASLSCRERPNPNIPESPVGYASQLTHMWWNIPAPCTLLSPQPCQGRCDRCALLAASMPSSGAPRNLRPWDHLKHDPRGVGMSLCLRSGEPQESFLHVEVFLLECWEEPTEIVPDGMLPFLL